MFVALLTFCRNTQILGMICQELGFDCVVLHSLIRQKERLAALAKFKSNQVRILIATDVASRYVVHDTVRIILVAWIDLLKFVSTHHWVFYFPIIKQDYEIKLKKEQVLFMTKLHVIKKWKSFSFINTIQRSQIIRHWLLSVVCKYMHYILKA